MMARTWRWRLPTAFFGVLLLAIGFIGPWIPHRTAALTVTGVELVEFAKFFPQVQAGTVSIVRALFILPLVASAVELGLLTHGTVGATAARIAATGLALALALAALPPYQFLRDPDYRLQLILAMMGLLLALLTILSNLLSARIRGALISLIALASILPTAQQFAVLHPLAEALYQTSLPIGWGAILCWLGGLTLTISGLSAALGGNSRSMLS